MRKFFALAFLLGACSTSPQPRYYVLEAVASSGAPATQLTVLVEPVEVPAGVDRPQVVLDTKANEVAVDELHRWAAPLQDNVAEVLASDLSARLGTREVSTSQDGSAPYRYRVNTAIREFRSRLGEYAQLDAGWSVRRADGATRAGYSRVREAVRGSDFAALAAAHSRAVSCLSEEIAGAILALEKDP